MPDINVSNQPEYIPCRGVSVDTNYIYVVLPAIDTILAYEINADVVEKTALDIFDKLRSKLDGNQKQ